MIRTSTSPAVSAVFVDEAGRRRRYLVILGRAALAVLVVPTAAMVTALLTEVRLPLLGLPDGVAAPAERAIRALSELPRPAAEQRAGRRLQAGAPLSAATPLPSASSNPTGRVTSPVDAPIGGPTSDSGRPAGTGEARTGPHTGRFVTAPEPVRPRSPAPSRHPSEPAKTPAGAQGGTPAVIGHPPRRGRPHGSAGSRPARASDKPTATAESQAPAKSTRPAASTKAPRSAPGEAQARSRPAARPTESGRTAANPTRKHGRA